MSKLSDDDINFIRLVQRSPDRGDGWRSVSALLWRMVEGFARQELIERERNEDGTGRVRLNERGNIVAEYLT